MRIWYILHIRWVEELRKQIAFPFIPSKMAANQNLKQSFALRVLKTQNGLFRIKWLWFNASPACVDMRYCKLNYDCLCQYISYLMSVTVEKWKFIFIFKTADCSVVITFFYHYFCIFLVCFTLSPRELGYPVT